ncbi:related to dynactin subunit p62 [Ustilago trichophora]|uniref:Dynactin subunit 4 n=1 Tax=Ustilago trichophora TaxID=86804 RepID=A0A5C3E2C6_9BASI|nr:related to dynactin subunit p62 [Ustilago trichophora]
MASPHVLYFCPCNQAHSNSASTSSASSSRQRHTSTLASPPPGLPAYSPASRYAFHPLESLYFCDECDEIRCNRCVTVDISSYYCPNCLFEVPGASVKAEKNRCARNCFECPCCQHTLSLLASDLASASARSVDLTDPLASQGEPPYYLGCSFCRWDSKSIGLVFEKPTGLSLQLQRNEDNAPDVLEFDRLKDHFDPYLKAQTQAAITSAAIGSASSSRSRALPASSASTALPSSSSTATSSRSARANAARTAAAAALQSSKLVRDLPHLAHSKHLAGTGLASSSRSGPIEPDELKKYRALNPWQSALDTRSSSSSHSSPTMGVMAKREKHRKDYVARIQPTPNQPFASLDDKISSLEQRWSSVSIADQPVRAAELRPTRVPLKSKLSKRCPACRHIVIKPDIKAASNRFKIKLVAQNFLPEIQIALAAQQPYLDPLRFRSTRTGGSSLGAGTASGSLRRRPPSVLMSQSGTDPIGSSSSVFATSHDVDVNTLVAGQTYTFQITITNPLDDPVQVTMSFVRFADPAHSNRSAQSTASGGRNGAVQPLPQPRYIFSSTSRANPSKAPADQVLGDTGLLHSSQPIHAAKRPRLGWQVYPSATSVPLNAFNEVWELEEAEDLYASKNESGLRRASDSYDDADTSQRRYAVKTATVRNHDGTGPTDESAWVIQEDEDDEDDDGYDDSDDAEEQGQGEQDGAFSDINEEQEDGDQTASKVRAARRSTAQRRHLKGPSTLSQSHTQHRRSQLSSASSSQRIPFIQRGHTTSLYLDLAISAKDPPKSGPLELAMHVSYRYTPAAGQEGESGAAAAGKDFSFWTSIRLGTVVHGDTS